MLWFGTLKIFSFTAFIASGEDEVVGKTTFAIKLIGVHVIWAHEVLSYLEGNLLEYLGTYKRRYKRIIRKLGRTFQTDGSTVIWNEMDYHSESTWLLYPALPGEPVAKHDKFIPITLIELRSDRKGIMVTHPIYIYPYSNLR